MIHLLITDHPPSTMHKVQMWASPLPIKNQIFWRDILKTSNKQTQEVMQTLFRWPWGRYTNSGLQTPHLTKRLATYIICWLFITLMTWNRKYRSGFITTMLAQSTNTPSSLGNGQPGMPSSGWTTMRLWNLQQRCLASSQASQGFWEIKTRPLLSWMMSLLKDLEEYAQAAKEWSKESPPPHIQSRSVNHYLLDCCN